MRAGSIAISTSLVLFFVFALGSVAQAKPEQKFGPAVDAFCGFDPPVYGKPYTLGTDPWPQPGESCGGCHTGYPGLPVTFDGCDPNADADGDGNADGSKCERQPYFDWWKPGDAAGGDFSAFCLPPSNNAPIADAGPDQSVPVGTTVTLDGSGSNDLDADPLTYSWTLTAPPGSAASLSDPSAVMPTFSVDMSGTYTADLVVNDGIDDSAPDSVSVSTINSPPVASAGADQSVFVGATVTLDGSGSSDVDGDVLTFSWTLTGPAGSSARLSDPSAVMPSFVADAAGTYVAQLMVNDGSVDSSANGVMVTTQNTPPVANAGPDQAVFAGATVRLDGSASSDVDGDALSHWWSLSSVPAGSSAALSDPSAVMPSFVADVAGAYVAQLIVNDGTVDSDPDTVSVLADVDNVAPVADAGPDQSVAEGATVMLDGSGSSDVNGDPLRYSWSLTSVPAGSSATLPDPSAVMPSFVADVAGAYVAQLIVHDGAVDSAPDTVVVTTEAGNTAPMASAGPDQSVFVGDVVTLDGSGSSDVDRDPLSYSWSLTMVPTGSNAGLSDANAVMPSFVADVAGAYVAQLIVRDGTVDSPPDTVVINTEARNTAPVANAGPDQSVPDGATVALDGSGSSDADGDALRYLWSILSRPAGSTATLSDPTAMMPTFVDDLSGEFVVQLIVNDGSVDSAPDTVAITAKPPGNTPPVADAGPDQSVATGDLVTLDGSASTHADGQSLSYGWSLTVPAGSSAVLTGADTASPSFVADVAGSYTASLVVNDGTVGSAPDAMRVSAQLPGDAQIDAVWAARKSLLKVKGEGFSSGAVIEVYGMYRSGDVAIGKAYESRRGDGSWRFKTRLDEDEVPCRVKAVADDGSLYYSDVRRAPDCDGGEDSDDSDSDDSDTDSDSRSGADADSDSDDGARSARRKSREGRRASLGGRRGGDLRR